MAHGRGGRTPRRDTPRVSAIGLARTPTLRKAVAFEQRRGCKPPHCGDRGSGGGTRGALRSSLRPARAHTLIHLLPLVASSGMRKHIFSCGLGISGANLSYANLSYANLSYVNLSYANLSEANLSSANLSWANLSWANLNEADLSKANLTEADLSKANLSGSCPGIPSRKRLTSAVLT